MKYLQRTTLTLLFVVPSLLMAEPAVTPQIYVFQNGLHFKSAAESARIVNELGYAGIGQIYPHRLAEFKAACVAEKMKLFSIYINSRVNENDFSYDKNIAESFSMLEGTNALVELNLQRGNRPNDAQAVALVREIADLAKQSGLKVVIYPHYQFFIERMDHALRIAMAAERENLGIAFNLCHYLKVQPSDDLRQTLTAAKPFLWSVSINGADHDGKDWKSLIRPLDEGTFDQKYIAKILREIGYDGPVGLQCFNISIDPQKNLLRSIGAWRAINENPSTPR